MNATLRTWVKCTWIPELGYELERTMEKQGFNSLFIDFHLHTTALGLDVC